MTLALNNPDDAAAPIVDIMTQTEIGPAGLRAFCAALLAKGRTMRPNPYSFLKVLRLWRANPRDGGVAALVRSCNRGAA